MVTGVHLGDLREDEVDRSRFCQSAIESASHDQATMMQSMMANKEPLKRFKWFFRSELIFLKGLMWLAFSET